MVLRMFWRVVSYGEVGVGNGQARNGQAQAYVENDERTTKIHAGHLPRVLLVLLSSPGLPRLLLWRLKSTTHRRNLHTKLLCSISLILVGLYQRQPEDGTLSNSTTTSSKNESVAPCRIGF